MRLKHPDPETYVASTPGAMLYAWLADVPLYVHVKLITADQPEHRLVPDCKRRVYWLAWIIDEQRLVRSTAAHLLHIHAPDTLEWIRQEILKIYPDHATATGLSAAEVAELKAEQKAKKDLRKKAK